MIGFEACWAIIIKCANCNHTVQNFSHRKPKFWIFWNKNRENATQNDIKRHNLRQKKLSRRNDGWLYWVNLASDTSLMYLPVGWTHVTARMICQDRSFTSSIKRIICNCCELDNVNSQQCATETPHRFLLNILSGRLSFTMQKIWFKNNNQNLIHQLLSDSAPIIFIVIAGWCLMPSSCANFVGFWQFWFLVITWRKLVHCSSTSCRQHSFLLFSEISNADEKLPFIWKMTVCSREILIFKCVSFALFFLIMLMYYLCLLRGFFIHSDQNIWGENSGKLDYTSKKDKSQITDWIFKIQHNCANMMSNTKQMAGYK